MCETRLLQETNKSQVSIVQEMNFDQDKLIVIDEQIFAPGMSSLTVG